MNSQNRTKFYRFLSLLLAQSFLVSSLLIQPLYAQTSSSHLRPRPTVTRGAGELQHTLLSKKAADGGAGLPNRLRELREREGLNLHEASERLGFLGKKGAIWYRWENGINSPLGESLLKIAKAFGVSVNFLVTGIDLPVIRVDQRSFPERLSDLRRERGWSPIELEERSGVGESLLLGYEKNRSGISLRTLLALSEALEVEPGYLLAGEEIPYLPSEVRRQYGTLDLSAYSEVVFPLARKFFKEGKVLTEALDIILEKGLDWPIRNFPSYFAKVAPWALEGSRGRLKKLEKLLEQARASARDGGHRSKRDFTINVEGETLDLLEIALKGEADVSQMEQWIALLQKRDQIPVVSVPEEGPFSFRAVSSRFHVGADRLKRLYQAGVIHPKPKKGRFGHFLPSEEVRRLVHLTTTDEAARRLKTDVRTIYRLVEEGVLKQDRQVHEVMRAKSIDVVSLNQLIEKESVIVSVAQVVPPIHAQFGISVAKLYEYVRKIEEVIGPEKAQELFGRTDITQPTIRTIRIGDPERFPGITLLDLLKLTKELKRLQTISRELVPVSTLASEFKDEGLNISKIHFRIDAGLLEGVTIRPLLTDSPWDIHKTTYLSPETAQKIRRLFERTIRDRLMGLSRIRPDERWEMERVASLWGTLSSQQQEELVFLLKWYQDETLTPSLVRAYEVSQHPAIPIIFQKVGTASLYEKVRKTAGWVTESSPPYQIRHLVQLIHLVGEIEEKEALALLQGLLDHPLAEVRLAAQESFDKIENPPLPIPKDYFPKVGDMLYHRQFGEGRVVETNGAKDHLLVLIQFGKFSRPKQFLWHMVRHSLSRSAQDGGRIVPLPAISPSLLIPFRSP